MCHFNDGNVRIGVECTYFMLIKVLDICNMLLEVVEWHLVYLVSFGTNYMKYITRHRLCNVVDIALSNTSQNVLFNPCSGWKNVQHQATHTSALIKAWIKNYIITMQAIISNAVSSRVVWVKCIVAKTGLLEKNGYIWLQNLPTYVFIMTSSNGSIFRVTGILRGELPITGEFPSKRPVTQNFWCFIWSAPEQTVE